MGRPAMLFVNSRPGRVETEASLGAARRLGLDVVVLGPRGVELPPGACAERIEIDMADPVAAVHVAEEVATRREVAGVVGWTDDAVPVVARIAAALGLPGHPVEVADRVVDRARLHERLDEAAPGVAPRWGRPGDLEFPLVLKPVAGGGLRVLTSADELDALAAGGGDWIVEEFVDGSAHTVEGFLLDKRLIGAEVTDAWARGTGLVETLQIHPSTLPLELQDAAVWAAERAAHAVGLHTGTFFAQIRVSGGAVRVVDLCARAPGAYITSHLFPLARAYDALGATLMLACGMRPGPVPPAFAVAGSYLFLSPRAGRFRALDGIDRALARPGIVAVVVDRPLGSEARGVLATTLAVGYRTEAVVDALDTATQAMSPVIA